MADIEDPDSFGSLMVPEGLQTMHKEEEMLDSVVDQPFDVKRM